MAMNNGLRSCVSKLQSSTTSVVLKPESRGFHSTVAKRMGGHAHDGPYYEHSKRMYNLHLMSNQGPKMSLFVFTCFSIGTLVPIYAVVFQQKKAKSS